MNPIVIAGGIIALLYWNSKSKTQTQVSQSDAPKPSPANPVGLDKPTGPSTTSEPVSSPANPVGLEKDLEPEQNDSGTKSEYIIVDDGNWSPSPANPRGLEQELDPQKKVKSDFEKVRSQIIKENPSSELRFAMNDNQLSFLQKLKKSKYPSYRDFAAWVERKRNAADFNQLSMRTTMSASQRLRYILKFLDQKEELNNSIIDDYIKDRDDRIRQRQLEKQGQKERAAKPKPKVFAGKVLDENGNYVSPTSQESCPSGFRFLSRAGWSGCVSEERYAEVMSEMAKSYPLLPPKQWSQAILLTYAGNLTDKAALTMPTDKLIEMIRQRAVGCTNKWCKVINDSFITDSTSFVLDRFEYRGVVFGKMDENWIAFYPIPVKVAGKKRKKDLPYIMFALSEQEFKTYKDLAKYYKATK